MPKLLNNPQLTILNAAKDELSNHPETFSMRIIAKKANIAVGTIYRYYPDKINLIAAVLLEDWKREYKLSFEKIENIKDISGMLYEINNLIDSYRNKHQNIFSLYKGKEMNMDYPSLHKKFVSEITNLYQEGKRILKIPLNDEQDILISELILIQARRKDISFKTLVNIVENTLKEENSNEK